MLSVWSDYFLVGRDLGCSGVSELIALSHSRVLVIVRDIGGRVLVCSVRVFGGCRGESQYILFVRTGCICLTIRI